MAKRVQQQEQPTSSAADAALDLATIFPESTISINGENITVNEYPFVTWVGLKQHHHQFIAQLTQLVADADDHLLVDDLLEFFEDHFTDMCSLISDSIHKPWEWLDTLQDSDMQQLVLTWWQVNKHFFLRAIGRNLRKQNKPSAGQTSVNP